MTSIQEYKKSIRIIFVTLLVYAVLVATHLGEFWPFSIYPMFSQAGKPWKRAIIRDVTEVSPDKLWTTTDQQGLPGKTFPLNDLNVNTNDVANYIAKTEVWTAGRINGIRKLLKSGMGSKNLMIFQAQGSLLREDSIIIEFVPYIYLTADTTILNKQLKTEQEREFLE